MDTTSNNKKKIGLVLAFLFVFVVFVAGIIALVQNSHKQPESTTSDIRIAITEDGFSPATVTVNSGMTVVWVNNTAAPRKIGANPYPDAGSLPDLLSGDIAPGSTYSYTFRSSGNFEYADYTRPTVTGTVQVK